MSCYIIAKDTDKRGCVALKSEIGQELVALRRELNKMVSRRGIQIVVISRPTAYGEYAPYSFVHSANELKEAVRRM